MLKQELIRRSPVRILEQSTHGGVGPGNIGVFASRKGIGKTACLVHVATDRLLAGAHVIHVSFADKSDHILDWYEDIFEEIAKRTGLDNARDIHDEIAHNRIIMNFRQDGIHITEIRSRIHTLIEQGNFAADTMVIDGYDFSRSDEKELAEFKRFAAEHKLELWFSATVDVSRTSWEGNSVPPELSHVIDEIAVCIGLKPHKDNVKLMLIKDHDAPSPPDMHLMLDPGVLIISQDN
jgi:KaiC/GvpD/RAD55 family RecA-like ATPase